MGDKNPLFPGIYLLWKIFGENFVMLRLFKAKERISRWEAPFPTQDSVVYKRTRCRIWNSFLCGTFSTQGMRRQSRENRSMFWQRSTHTLIKVGQ